MSLILQKLRQGKLGWTYRGAAYCQIIREANKLKRLSLCLQNQTKDLKNVIWTDETTFQLENHRRFSHRKRGEKPRPKPRYWTYVLLQYLGTYNYYRPKHPVKIHVWAGISMNGRTDLVMFDEIMDAILYVRILREALIPSAQRLYPAGNYLFMQDNDPKHTSRCAREFFDNNGIEWWKTPAESPDLNPIKNLWHELKEYIRREVKPKTKDDLLEGIRNFGEL